MTEQEKREIIHKGAQASALVGQPGYKDLLDFLESKSHARLGSLRSARYGSKETISALYSEWMRWEDILHEAQRYPYSLIEAARQVQNVPTEVNE